jgi:DNA-binding LacI/PurR family transcriptional regulator
LSETNFETHFVRLRDAVWHVRNEVEKASADPAFVGFILALGTREVQRYLADVTLPVVVYGSVYPGIKLPFVEIDQKQCGRLMAKEAIDAGHRRLIVINRELWRRGDTLMLDGVTELVHAAGLGAGAVTIRNISPGPDAVAAEIDHLLDELRGPTALLCRSNFYARAALEAATRRHMTVPEDLTIISSDTEEEGLPLPYPCVRCRLDMRSRFAMIGRMLSQLGEGRVLDPDRVMLSLEMEQPSAHPFPRKGVLM